MLYQPLEQFEIFTLFIFSFNIINWFIYVIITNLIIYLLILFVIVSIYVYINIFLQRLFCFDILSGIFEIIYKFLLNLLINQSGLKGRIYFQFIFTLFIFIAFSNLIGIMPFSYTITSHIVATISLGFTVLFFITSVGFINQKLKFINLFIPSNIPLAVLPILVIIEIVSFASRGLSLSIRLFANIMSGHVLLYILSSFVFKLYKVNKILALFTLFIIVVVSCLEFFLAILQAYVFTVLTCIYLNDSLNESNH